MVRRILVVIAGALLALPLTAASASAGPECKPPHYTNCARPVWCDGTGYSCDATGFAQWLADEVVPVG